MRPAVLLGIGGVLLLALAAWALTVGSAGHALRALWEDGQAGLILREVRMPRVIAALGCGAALAVAGPLGFVGLVVPHMARLTLGADFGRILPLAALLGAALVLLADTLPRALWARDIPVGVTLALLGAPVFIWLARTRR